VASDIEDAYAEIGRSVVIRAIEQAISAGVAASGEAENAVTIRLLLEPGKRGAPTILTCICMRDTGEIWTCAGPGCSSGHRLSRFAGNGNELSG
jgi:hypothetical protein